MCWRRMRQTCGFEWRVWFFAIAQQMLEPVEEQAQLFADGVLGHYQSLGLRYEVHRLGSVCTDLEIHGVFMHREALIFE